MSLDLVVVRRPYTPGRGPVRTGSVVDRDGDLHVVQWDDTGAREEVHLGDYEHATMRDSVEHLGLTGRLEAVFSADALATVLRVLADEDTPMNGRQIKAYLLDRGLPKAVWDTGWAKIRQELPGVKGVETAGDKGARTFAWAGDDLPALPIPEPEPVATPQPLSVPEPVQASAPEPVSTPEDESAPEPVSAAEQAAAPAVQDSEHERVPEPQPGQ